jgi:ketosteroid isomerase-like protein
LSEEATAPDLAGFRSTVEADSYDEFAASIERAWAAHALLDLSHVGLGTFEGLGAILAFIKEWWSMWEEHHHYVDDNVDLGHGVGYTVIREDGRMKGSAAHVEARNAWVTTWDDGKAVRITVFTDIDEGCAAAERLAEETGAGGVGTEL